MENLQVLNLIDIILVFLWIGMRHIYLKLFLFLSIFKIGVYL